MREYLSKNKEVSVNKRPKKDEEVYFSVYPCGIRKYRGYFVADGVLVYVDRKNGDTFLTPYRCEQRCRQIAKKLDIELPKL